MAKPNHAGAIAYALHRLRTELPPELTYHNLYHTQEDIMPAVLRLAELCRLDEDELDLLLVAAAYHDIGFLETYSEHEQAGVQIMAQALPRFGFSSAQIERLVNLVLITRLPQSPTDRLGEILADSDLDVLGREDFFERSQALRQEVSTLQGPVAQHPWLEGQLDFLQSHTYFTPEAQSLRGAGKQRNIDLLTDALQEIPD